MHNCIQREMDAKVETISRLVQWKIETFGPCTLKRSDPFKMGPWTWNLSVEKNRHMYIRLFPEPTRIAKEQPPIAKFILRVTATGGLNRRPYISPIATQQQIIERQRRKAEALQGASSSRAILGPEAEQVIPEEHPINSPPRENEETLADPRKRPRKEDVVKTYTPKWCVLATDGVSSSAPPGGAREVGPEICKGLVLPADRPIYDAVRTVDACTEMMALLSMAAPWAAVIAERVDGLQAEFKEIEQLKTRAVKAEEDLCISTVELERVTGQATALRLLSGTA